MTVGKPPPASPNTDPKAGKEASTARLVREARHLRDHLLHMPGKNSSDLTAALVPFENGGATTTKELHNLSSAFENAFDSATRFIDVHTLSSVLAGRSPSYSNESPRSAIPLVFVGIALVFLAFHYTYWASKASNLLIQSEEFIEFQHFERLMDVASQFIAQQSNVNAGSENLPTTEVAERDDAASEQSASLNLALFRDIDTLRYQYHMEKILPAQLHNHSGNLNPAARALDVARTNICPDVGLMTVDLASLTPLENLLCRRSIETYQQVQKQALEDTETSNSSTGSESDNLTETATRDESLDNTAFGQIRTESIPETNVSFITESDAISRVQGEADRSTQFPYIQSIFSVETMQRELNQKLSVANYWALPMIYGALGALTYCLWRTLTPRVSSLGFWHPVMRMVFAALAALTISMIFIPANIITLDQNAQKPLIYVISFIFGYSIEGFIRLLNKMNATIENGSGSPPG